MNNWIFENVLHFMKDAKVNFNTKRNFSTLNYDPSSEINFNEVIFMRGGVVK